jgi:hypothetical protein
MSTTTLLLVSVVTVGLVLAVFYGAVAVAQLIQIRRLPPLDRQDPGTQEAAVETPTRRFKGEVFESAWQGSRGYDRPADQRASENLADRFFVTTFTPLRPSRFGQRSYWTRYLPAVSIFYVCLFIGAPILVGTFAQPTTGSLATFAPTPAQRAIPGHGSYVSRPTACDKGAVHNPSASPVVGITYADDGTVFGVPSGGRVVISYLYGQPVFASGTPLCPDSSKNTQGHEAYVAASTGAGFVYIPQPNGTVVAEIDVTSSHVGLLVVLIVVALAILTIDILLTIALKRSANRRFSNEGR